MGTFDENSFSQIVSRVLKIEAREKVWGKDLRMEDVLDWDSLAHLDLIFQLESGFGVAFDLDQIGELNTLDKLRESLQKNLKEKLDA